MAAYISGYSNTMDVAGFGFNTQSAMFYQSQHASYDIHEGVTCDSCGSSPLRGIRWRCQSCPDHDICNNCKTNGSGAGHQFQIMSVAATSNQIAAAQGQSQSNNESGVHWTTCKGCSMYPIRATLYACMTCPNFDLCENCNQQRISSNTHQHRFDFFYCPRACNPPPQQMGHQAAQQYNTYGQQQYTEAEQQEILHMQLVEQQEQQQGVYYDNSIASQQQYQQSSGYDSGYSSSGTAHGSGGRRRDRVIGFMNWLNDRH